MTTGSSFPALKCFVGGCMAPLAVTRSWRTDATEGVYGPTLHACRDHAALLPHSRPDTARELQAVLL